MQASAQGTQRVPGLKGHPSILYQEHGEGSSPGGPMVGLKLALMPFHVGTVKDTLIGASRWVAPPARDPSVMAGSPLLKLMRKALVVTIPELLMKVGRQLVLAEIID